MLRELEINEIKKEAKLQMNELEIEKNKVLDNFKFELRVWMIKKEILEEIKQIWRWKRIKNRI